MNKPILITLLVSTAVLSGCRSMYESTALPDVETPDAWVTPITSEEKIAAKELAVWWTAFDDETLTRLVQRSLDNNLDLQNAAARVEEAFALRDVAAGERVPQVNGAGGIFETNLSELEGGTAGTSSFTAYSLGLDASWELDLWGRIGQIVEAADATAQASIEDLRGVRALIAAEVADTYISFREQQLRQKLATGNILLQRDTLRLTKGRFDTGLAPQLDVNQAQLNLSVTEAVLPALHQQEIINLRRLEVLIGAVPGTLNTLLDEVADVPLPAVSKLRDLPANVLRRRPDIRAAEQRFVAAASRVGVAKADLYPRISLSGTFAWEASEPGKLFDSSSVSSSFGPSIYVPIFQGGRLKAQVDVAESRAMQAELTYRQLVLDALSDVETSITRYQQELKRYEKLQAAVKAAELSVKQVRSLYENGLVTFLNVLDTERSLAAQQDQAAESMGNCARNLVKVYRALGGGWDAPVFDEPVKVVEQTRSDLSENQAELFVESNENGVLTLKVDDYLQFTRLDEASEGMVSQIAISLDSVDAEDKDVLTALLPGERVRIGWNEVQVVTAEKTYGEVEVYGVERLSPPSP